MDSVPDGIPGSFTWRLNLENNTGPLVQGFEQLVKLSAELRNDVVEINKGLDDTFSKAQQVRGAFNDTKDVLSEMHEIVGLITTATDGLSQNLKGSITSIAELLSQARSLGISPGQIANFMGGMPLGASNPGGFNPMDTMAARQLMGFDDNSTYTPDLTPPYQPGDFTARVEKAEKSRLINAAENPMIPLGEEDEEEYRGAPLRDKFSGKRRKKKGTPASGGSGGPTSGSVRVPRYARNFSEMLQNAAPRRYREIANGLDPRGYTDPVNHWIKETDQLLSAIPGSGELRRGLRATRAVIQHELTSNPNIQRYQNPDGSYSYTRTIPRDSEGNPDFEAAMGKWEFRILKSLNRVSDIFDAKSTDASKKSMGQWVQDTATTAAQIYAMKTIATAPYNMAKAGMGPIQSFVSQAQEVGSLTGGVGYGQTAGLGMQAMLASDFNLNPYYSSANAANAQRQGLGIGLGNGDLGAYVDNSLSAMKDLGISTQQYGSMSANAYRYGIQNNDLRGGLTQAGYITSSTPNTSAAATNASFQAGAFQAAGYGMSSQQSVQAGVLAGQFAAGNRQLQGIGANGTEFLNGQIGQALVAQELGVSPLGLAGALHGGAGDSGKLAKATDQALLGILGNIGITKDTKDADLWKGDTPGLLLNILPSVGITNVKTPQDAVNYVSGVLKRMKNPQGYKPQHDTGSAFGNLVRSVGKGISGVVGGIARDAGHAGNWVVDKSQVWRSSESTDAELRKDNAGWDKSVSNVGHGIMNSFSTGSAKNSGPAAAGRGGSSESFHVTVGLHPNAERHLTIATNSAQSWRTGQNPSNRQPAPGQLTG